MGLKKPPVVISVLTAAACAVLFTLGMWQLQRLHEKQALIAALEAEYARDPQHLEMPAVEIGIRAKDMTRALLHGTYMRGKSIFLTPRTHEGEAGKHVVTPLRLSDGSYVLVNRGWAPDTWTEPDTDVALQVLGMFRAPKRGFFTPENDAIKNQWYFPDTQQIAQHLKLEQVHTLVLYAEEEQYRAYHHARSEFPVSAAIRPAPANNHLSYAMFWFSMAVALLAVFLLRFVREGNGKP